MSVTYPPELLPISSPDEEAEVIVCGGGEPYLISDSRQLMDAVAVWVDNESGSLDSIKLH